MTDPAGHVETIFNAAVLLPGPEERAAYLARACGDNLELRARVEALLRTHDDSAGGAAAPWETATRIDGSTPGFAEGPGGVIGHYRLIELLGEGGFGAVYRAEQSEPVRRQVALKIIKAGMDTKEVIGRFTAERQALAVMDHPNIARVFDAGATATGRPYFVMELVRGVPITQYCDESQLTTSDRLELFMTVCDAVQHAHQKGIIHRDLKPSNILVSAQSGRAEPKVIDFGIAKATQQSLTDQAVFTQAHQFIGTPAYMSPEQAGSSGLDIDTRTDVYSLGVVLYELLTGRTPFETKDLMGTGYDDFRRNLLEREPPTPSTRLRTLPPEKLTKTARHRRTDPGRLASSLEGDLDWIVLKALEKDRSRRYESASAFAADLRRHLNNEPVSAARPSAYYRFQKFARRNRGLLTAGASVAVALILGTVVSIWQAAEAKLNANRANALTVVANQATAQAKSQEQVAQQEKTRAQAAEKQTKTVLVRADYQAALRLVETDHDAEAVAHLARALRMEPGHEAIATLLLTTLARGHFTSPPQAVEVDATAARLAVISSRGSLIAFPRSQAVVLIDAATGQPRGDPLAVGGEVQALALSPDDSHLAVGLGNRTIELFHLRAGGKKVLPLAEDIHYVGQLQITPDGNRLVARGAVRAKDQMHHLHPILAWNLPSGEQVPMRVDAEAHGPFLVITLDSKRVITVEGEAQPGQEGPRNEVAIRDLADGRLSIPRLMHDGPVMDVALAPDGRTLLTASLDRRVRVWDLGSGELRRTFTNHASPVLQLALHPAGTRVLSLSADGKALLWDLQTGGLFLEGGGAGRQPISPGDAEKRWHSLAAFSPDGVAAFTAIGTAIQVRDVDSGQLLFPPLEQDYPLRSGVVSHDGGRLITLPDLNPGATGHLRIWPLATPQAMPTQLRQPDGLAAQAMSPDGRRVVTAFADRTVRVWDPVTGREVMPPLRHSAGVNLVEISPDGNTLATVADMSLFIWDLASGQLRAGPLPQTAVVTGLSFSLDSSHVITLVRRDVERQSQTRQQWRIWESRTGTLARQFSTDQDRFPAVRDSAVEAAFNADASRLALAGPTNVWIFDLRTQPPEVVTLNQPGVGGKIEFSPDGSRLVTGALGNKVARLWDAASGAALGAGMETKGSVLQVTFSPDGTRVVTQSDNGYARFWDAASGAPLTEHFQIGEESVIRAVEPRGRRLLTGKKIATGFTAQVWDVDSGLPVTPGLDMAFGRFLDQGQWLMSRRPGLISLRELPLMGSDIPAWLPDLGESLVGQRFNASGFLEAVPAAERLRLAQTIAPMPEADGAVRWAKWLLAASGDRATSPLALRSWDDYVEGLAEDESWETAQPGDTAAKEDRQAGKLLRELRQVLRSYPLHPLAMARLGRELGQTTNALAQAEAEWLTRLAWARAPESKAVARWRGDYLLSSGRGDEAMVVLDLALLRFQDDSGLHALRGLALEQQGRLQEAEEAYSAAIRTASTTGDLSGTRRREILTNRGRVRQKLGQGPAAQEDRLASWQVPPRPAGLDPSLIDLSGFYNAGLLDGWLVDPGPASGAPGVLALDPGHDLSFLPQGKAMLGGVPFDVRGAVVLQATKGNPAPGGLARPASVRGIPVGRNFERLHLLVGLTLGGSPERPLVGSYRVIYADGETDTIPLRMGRDLWDSWQVPPGALEMVRSPPPEGTRGPRSAALGLNPAGHLLVLFRTTWKNPQPEKLVTKLDLNFFASGGTLFVVGVTAEDRSGHIRFLLDQHTPEATSQALNMDASAAAAHIKKELREDPANPAHWAALGLLEKARSRFAEAEEAFSQALKASGSEFSEPTPAQSLALRQRSEVRVRLGKMEEAKADRLQALGIPGRDERATPAQIDLSLHYGSALTNSWVKGVGMSERNDLADLAPLGTKTLAGTAFDVRGVIQLANNVMAQEKWEPERVDGIEVGAKCRHLYFLHAAAWGNGVPGTRVAHYEVHYADGQTVRMDIKVGEDIWDYWYYPNTTLQATHAEVAWMGVNEASKRFEARTRLFKLKWENPRPDVEIQTISLVSALGDAAPFVIAITRD